MMPPKPETRPLMESLARLHGISMDDILGPSRSVPIARARQHIAYELWWQFRLSKAAIGKLLGGRDHTTIGHAIRQWPKKAEQPAPTPRKRISGRKAGKRYHPKAISKPRADPKPVRVPVDARKVRDLAARGHTFGQIAAIMRAPYREVQSIMGRAA